MSWDNRPHRGRQLLLLAGVYCGPLLAIFCYAFFFAWALPAAHWEVALEVFALLGIAVGLACIACLPEPVAVRVFLALLYPPAAIAGTMLFLVLTGWLTDSR